ncbi:unnamed protein product [Cuscuta europaea]|uniref:Uncharacterized protein n=1 Tax=Cuscuta europaea TaxID=41803 RepID=A0A9P1DZ24_CUSEU|nr:unnamed protein product [Cuscuta europaea]
MVGDLYMLKKLGSLDRNLVPAEGEIDQLLGDSGWHHMLISDDQNNCSWIVDRMNYFSVGRSITLHKGGNDWMASTLPLGSADRILAFKWKNSAASTHLAESFQT